MTIQMMHGIPAVFLDRDGTIIEDTGNPQKIEDLAFVEGAVDAIAQLTRLGIKTIVVTNDASIARGDYDIAQMNALHEEISRRLVEQGGHIDAFYHCPHHPTEGLGELNTTCSCRKPNPGILVEAAKEHGVDLERSYIVGDTLEDVEAGQAVECLGVLVRTGQGEEAEQTLSEQPILPDLIVNTLPEAVDWILIQMLEERQNDLAAQVS